MGSGERKRGAIGREKLAWRERERSTCDCRSTDRGDGVLVLGFQRERELDSR